MLHPRPVLTNRFLLVSLAGLSGVAFMAPGGPWADEHTGPPPAEAAGHAHHHHHMPAVSRTTAAYAIPDVTLTDQNGRPIHLRTLLATDRPVMVNFINTSCTAICPVMSGTFARVQESLGADTPYRCCPSLSTRNRTPLPNWHATRGNSKPVASGTSSPAGGMTLSRFSAPSMRTAATR